MPSIKEECKLSEKILLVEDDLNLGASLEKYLIGEGFKVSWSRSLSEARSISLNDIDLIVLDWMLPDGQGVDYLKELRTENLQTPIIMLTARTELIDKVIGLESGANDYMTKPFEPRELSARIRSQIRFSSSLDTSDSNNLIIVGELEINTLERKVFFKKDEVDLTKMEFEFLKLLAESPKRAFSRDEILNKVWGYEHYPTTRTVDTHVLQLRQKLDESLIETVRGIGYKLVMV